MKKALLFLFLPLVLASCGTTAPSENPENTVSQTSNEKLLVTASIIPLASVINTIGGDAVEVNTIVPAGVSPHGFDLSAKQMVTIEDSQRIFLVWLEHIDGFLESASDAQKQIHLADGIELLEASEHEDHDTHGDEHTDEHDIHEDEHEQHDDGHTDEHDEHEDEHGGDIHNADPHVWLGKDNIIVIAQKIRDELSLLLPEQSAMFEENTQTFIADLEKLYSDFETQTSGKTAKEFIVFHDAYNYLMQSVGMDMNLKVPFSQNVLHEAGTAHMVELIEEIELHGITHVFREPQFSDGILQKFVDEYSLTLETLDPLGRDASANGYLDNIQSNLTALSNIYE